MSVSRVYHVCLCPPELLWGVCYRHYCIPCTLIHAEVFSQTITISNVLKTLVGLLSNDETGYKSDIDHFVSWYVFNRLDLNVIKTKEIGIYINIMGYIIPYLHLKFSGQNIDIIHSHKYLDTTDDKLRWDDNTMNLYKKGQQILYFLRKRKALHIDKHMLLVFHRSFVNLVLIFSLICYLGNLSVKTETK